MIQSWPKFLDRGQARLSFKDSVSMSVDHRGAGAAGIRVTVVRPASANASVIGPGRALALSKNEAALQYS
jgi:hypothetical protein